MPYSTLGDIQTLTLSNNVRCDNPCCILTLNCNVMLMGNMELDNYEKDTPLATLPQSMRPVEETAIPVYLGNTLQKMTVSIDGEMSIPVSGDAETLYTNGISFNVCGRYYNSEIGNNFSQGTSPLRWDGDDY